VTAELSPILIATHVSHLDEQLRISLPEQLLESLRNTYPSDNDITLVVIPNYHSPYLEIYPLSEWQKKVEDELPKLPEEHQSLLSRLIERSIRCQIDDGNIMITEAMVNHACLKDECVIAQHEGMLRVWDRDTYLSNHG